MVLLNNIFGYTRPALASALSALVPQGNADARARLLFRQIYKNRPTNSSSLKDVHAQILNQLSLSVLTPPVEIDSFHKSESDGSVKLVMNLTSDLKKIETVLIPERNRLTICLSTQVGCAQACRFCSTGRMGLLRSLSTAEIVGQLIAADAWRKKNATMLKDVGSFEDIRNVVFMGMGEPLDNLDALIDAITIFTDGQGLHLSPNRVTVSTVGLLPQLERLMSTTNASIALSIHSPFEVERSKIMPVNDRFPLADVVKTLRSQHDETFKGKQRSFFIQYTLIRNVNDSEAHAEALANLLTGIPVKVNLIPLNEHEGTAMRRPDLSRVYTFTQHLKSRGLVTTVRLSKGRDIGAACGQLIKKEQA